METIAIHCQGPYVLWKPALFVSLLWKELGYFFPCILFDLVLPFRNNIFWFYHLQAEVQNVKDAISSAVDVMQAMGSSMYSLLPKVFYSFWLWLVDFYLFSSSWRGRK